MSFNTTGLTSAEYNKLLVDFMVGVEGNSSAVYIIKVPEGFIFDQ